MLSRKLVISKFLYQDAYVMPLADKCVVLRCFLCGDFHRILMETGKISDHLSVTKNDSCPV